MTDKWEHIKTFADELSAEAFAGLLRSEGVPVEVRSKSLLPGLVTEVDVHVPRALFHRARWVLSSSRPTDAELIYEATGELNADDNLEP